MTGVSLTAYHDPIRSTLSLMSVVTTRDDVRIADSFGDGGSWSRRAPALGAGGGVLVVCALAVLAGATAWWFAPALLVAATAVGHDLGSGRLPDRLVAVAALFGFVAAFAVGDPDGAGGIAAYLTGALALSLPLFALHLASPRSMAFGDVKFAAALGGLVGVAAPDPSSRLFLAMTALVVASGAGVLVAVVVRRTQLPFGPLLFLGTCATLALADRAGSLAA